MSRWPWILLGGLVTLAIFFGLAAGQFSLGPSDLARALAEGPGGESEAAAVIWSLRLPRLATALLVGASLSAAGAAYQSIFRNPLVSPDILGVSAGAGLGASVSILLGLPLAAIQAAAFCGGLASVSLVYVVASWVRRHDPVLVLILSGIAVGTLFSSGISLVKVLADPAIQLPSITFWLLGGLSTATAGDLLRATPLFAASISLLFLLRHRVDLLTLADEEALALGENVPRLRLLLITGATLMTAVSVAISGIIGWVGLVVPHAARLLVGPAFARLLPASVLLGAAFVAIADTLARTSVAIELPLGILTAFVGAPLFLWLLSRSGRIS